MSDGAPTEEQLRQIRARVMDRIDRRRAVIRGVTGAAVAVVLVGGGIGLVSSLRVSGSASSGAAGGSSGGGTAAAVVVRCHEDAAADSAVRSARADPAALPGSARRACAGTTGTGAPAARTDVTVCRDADGRIDVYPAGAAICARTGSRVVR